MRQETIDLVARLEGFRSSAYTDSVGVWTIGFGFTDGVRPGQKMSLPEAKRLLPVKLQRYEDAVLKATKALLNPNELSALDSFTYNVGIGAYQKSTMLRLLNAGKRREAADQFLRWNKGGGRVIAGLTARRNIERALFLSIPQEKIVTETSTVQAYDPDGIEVDLPTLFPPYQYQASTQAVWVALGHTGRVDLQVLVGKVKEYQKKEGLVPDAIVGPVTWRHLLEDHTI